jgi:hypothetical protein
MKGAIERRGRPLAGLLDGMAGEFQRDIAGVADVFAHPLCKLHVMAAAGRNIGTGLRDADDPPVPNDFFLGQAEIEVALEIPRSCRDRWIVEPGLRAKAAPLRGAASRLVPLAFRISRVSF